MTEQATDPNTPGTNQVVIYPTSAGGVSIKRDDGTVLTLAGTGVLTVPATGTAATYANSTWVPVLKFGATTVAAVSVGGATYSTIGPMCFVNATLTLTAKNGTGTATIAGLPFTSGTGFWSGQIGYYEVLGSSPSGLYITVPGGATVLSLYKSTAGTSLTAMADTDFSTTTTLVFSLAYRMA
jgi:hypothetical protein